MRCPECGAKINPKKALEIFHHPTNPNLVQVYCRADCVLDALARGYPLKLLTLRPERRDRGQ